MLKIPRTTHFHGPHKGMVVQRTDPKRMGRLRVMVTGVYDKIPVPMLPWCLPIVPCAVQSGERWIPPLGSWVNVEFEGGDPEYPKWSGGWWKLDESADDTKAATCSGSRPGFKTSWFGGDPYPEGYILKFDKIDGASPADAPNNFGTWSPQMKRLELDERYGRQRVLVSDWYGNSVYVNTEHGVVTISSVNGVQNQDVKPMGTTFSSYEEFVQTWTFKKWLMTFWDKEDRFEIASPKGYRISINEKDAKKRITILTPKGSYIVLDDLGERIEARTPKNRVLAMDDKEQYCHMIGEDDGYYFLLDEKNQNVEFRSELTLNIKAAGDIRLSGLNIVLNPSEEGEVLIDDGTYNIDKTASKAAKYEADEAIPKGLDANEYPYYN